MRLVNMTKSIWPKIGLNMTETDEPYLFENDRIVTMTNVNLLNLTEKDWIWPKINYFLIFGYIHTVMFVVVVINIYYFIFGHIQMVKFVVVVIFIIFLVMFTMLRFVIFQFFSHVHKFQSYSFGHLDSVKLTFLFQIYI